MIENWENGDYDLAVVDALQLTCAISSIFMKCFTGATLVSTADGNKRIDEISVGDYVWAEDTVTGEKELKMVLKVYVKETDHLIHIGTSKGEDIKTTENHPFYIDGRGWVAASEVKKGDKLHTADGEVVTVTYSREEWLSEPIKVYNLEIEDLHTYYVTTDEVLVHNEYSAGDKTPGGREFTKHGAERANERGYSAEDVDSILDSWTHMFPQKEGRIAYAKSQTYGYDVVVMDKNGKLIVSIVGGNSNKGYKNTLRRIEDVIDMIKKYLEY